MTKILFYFPYQEECGVPVLFLRMSRWLAENHGDEYNVYVCDYADGAMARNLKKDDSVGLYVSGTPEGIFVKDGEILVMQSLCPYYFPKELHLEPKARIFYWTLHFRNLTPSLLPLPGLRDLPYNHLWIYRICSVFYRNLLGRMAAFINDMMTHKAHYFMDISTQQQTEAHVAVRKPCGMEYLPVPASNYDGVLKKQKYNYEVIDACWIGRISYEKTPILVHTLERCSQYAKERKQRIHFHVIGGGDFTDWVDNLLIENDYFTKTKCSPIKFSEIDGFLLENVDIMFAMGTSALESAKLGIPTVLVDYTATAKPINGDYKFRYIFERTGYDLGHLIGKADIEKGNKTLEAVFGQLIHNNQEVAMRSRIHFVDNHSLNSVGNKFYNILNKMTYTFDMIDPVVIERPLLLKVYNKLRGFNRFE